MRVCDNCSKRLDEVDNCRVSIEAYHSSGTYNHKRSQDLELCDECRILMLSVLKNIKVKV